MLTFPWRLKSPFPMTWWKAQPFRYQHKTFLAPTIHSNKALLLWFVLLRIHLRHPLSRLRLLVPPPVWLMLAQTGSTWQTPVTAEQSWACWRRTDHGALCPLPGTTTHRTRLRWSGSGPCTPPQRETQWSQRTDCWGWEFIKCNGHCAVSF